jgi:hypothetical protein
MARRATLTAVEKDGYFIACASVPPYPVALSHVSREKLSRGAAERLVHMSATRDLHDFRALMRALFGGGAIVEALVAAGGFYEED